MKLKKGAQFLGIEYIDCDGKKHPTLFFLEGNGSFTLDDNELHFTRWMPRKEFSIPLKSINHVDIGWTHNFRFIGLPILKITYWEKGKHFVFGICVGLKKTTEEWKEKIIQAIR